MGDVELLLLVLAIVYLAECLAWIPKGSLALVKAWRRNYLVRHPGMLPGNDRGSLYLAPVFPPLGTVFLVPGLPICLSPESVVSWPPSCLDPGGRPRSRGTVLSWDNIRSVRAKGHCLFINDQSFVNTGSSRQAAVLAHRLRQISSDSPDERVKRIDSFLQSSFDVKAARKRWGIFKKAQSRLRLGTNLLFLYLFILGPVLIFQYGLPHVGLLLVVGLLLQSVLISLRFRQLHKELFPGFDDDRFKYFFTMLLTPPAAIRAIDYLSKHFFASFHTLVLAEMILSPKDFEALARMTLIDLEYPLLPSYPSQSPEAIQCVRWFRARLADQARHLISAAGFDPWLMTSPKGPMEPDTVAYCPRCHAQFITARGCCHDCGGRSLESWPVSG